ncbi:hypothetical protein HMPREF0307_00684 [Corynebacterium sp. DNF00584]|nr:hypothetical protein HMPREF0307_00684 [Corynebacterium sp. DNF00584]
MAVLAADNDAGAEGWQHVFELADALRPYAVLLRAASARSCGAHHAMDEPPSP